MFNRFRSNPVRSMMRVAVGYLLLAAGMASAMSLHVARGRNSPAFVGTVVTFSAAAADTTGTHLWYRFRVRRHGGQYEMLRDFSPVSTIDWTAADHEGVYEIETAARNLDTGEVALTTTTFQFVALALGDMPVMSETANPLVFMYSVHACRAGAKMRVEFGSGLNDLTATPYETCQPGQTMNFYLAGMRAATNYTARHVVDTGSETIKGPVVKFTTGALPTNLYQEKVIVPRDAATPSAYKILLGSPFQINPVAYDLNGNVVWFGPSGLSYLTRVQAGGGFWGVIDTDDPATSVLRKFDLTGMTLLETNAARVSEQLIGMGKNTVTSFHHEALPLPDGGVAVLGSVEKILTDVQGAGPVDVLGDMIIVFDKDLNVVWAWDTFDNLDTHRQAVLGEPCTSNAGGCPPFFLAPRANDWTHGNAIQVTPDGNILYSSRHQDWLIKIAYANGSGDGHVIWKLGKDGDFQFLSNDPYPWFSHQHDANFEFSDPTKLLVFDNGNTRVAFNQGVGNSRGQVYTIDEVNRTATPVVNTDVGVYSQAVGSAQKLGTSGYHFDAGFVTEKTGAPDSYSFEVDPSGKIVYEVNFNAILYRTFRMQDMYTPN